MNRILAKIVKIAGPAAAGYIAGGPAGAVATSLGSIAGAAEKRRGQISERKGSKPVHKITAPAAAIAAPTVLSVLLEFFGVEANVAGVLCGSPTLTAAGLGALSIAVHQLGSGVDRAARARPISSEGSR